MRRMLAWPSTPSGLWAFYLLAGFLLMMGVFFGITWLYGGPDKVRGASMNGVLPWIPFTLLTALVAAIGSGGAALVAILRKGERSILMVLPLGVSTLALLFAIGELFEGSPR